MFGIMVYKKQDHNELEKNQTMRAINVKLTGWGCLFGGLFLTLCCNHSFAKGIDNILSSIKQLESNKDPKCYATASRLENFMFGTPLTDQARFKKNQLQTQWVEKVWIAASSIAKQENVSEIHAPHIKQAISSIFRTEHDEHKDSRLSFKHSPPITIKQHDLRQYGNIAYSLRAILSAQQASILKPEWNNLPLSSDAIGELKQSLDLLTLAVLKISDQEARLNNQYTLEENIVEKNWLKLAQGKTSTKDPNNQVLVTQKKPNKSGTNDLKLLKNIIQQKVASYEVYNDINNQLFVRNLQVYFARLSWPKDQVTAKKFKNVFTETLIAFAADLYKGAEQLALQRNHPFIRESDVNDFVKSFIPHELNEYEDALFFPTLKRADQVLIESYDMDSFRDTGIHWYYLQYAIQGPDFRPVLEPDPFAAEIIVENIAQFGVLSLRIAGIIGQSMGKERINSELYAKAIAEIKNKITQNAVNLKQQGNKKTTAIASALLSQKKPDSNQKNNRNNSPTYFSEITQESGIQHTHRSSDWLNRLLRSYLKKDNNTGIITIPPAFGGAGIAADDLNNDGKSDLLILSGAGNKLYLNHDGKKFVDVTGKAGINWIRPQDGQPGEPRQPIIADFDNDGLQDIFISYVNDSHRLYKNLGNGKFADKTTRANLGGKDLVGGPATTFDFDNDGLLDIYITYFGNYLQGVLPTLKRRNANGLPNRLFKNMGDFSFKDVTEGSNLDNTGWAQAVAHTDLDNDGLQDLIVGNDFGVNAYYKNLGNGKFKNIAAQIGTDKPSYTMNIGIADLNNDLSPDIYISNIVTMNKDEKYVLPNETTQMKFNLKKLAHMRVVEANDLFLSHKTPQNKLSYQLNKSVVDRGYSSTGWAWDADFFDFDNDGDEDLYVLNGMNEFNLYSSKNPYYSDPEKNEDLNIFMPVETKESNVFFENADNRLVNASKESGLDFLANSRSAAYLDFDNDGDLDIAVNNYHERVMFFRNNAESDKNNWIKIKLKGNPEKRVNLDAIGAKIIVTTKTGNRMWQEVRSTTGYMSVHPKTLHFGLGKDTQADVMVIWPNGEKKTLSSLSANSEHRVEL
jgi:hypothetical protein